MSSVIYEHGEALITVPATQKIQVYSVDIAQLAVKTTYPNHPLSYSFLYTTQPGEAFTSAAFSVDTIVKVNAGAAIVQYDVAVTPAIGETTGAINGTTDPFELVGLGGPTGGVIRLIGGSSTSGSTLGGNSTVRAGVGGPTGPGGQANLVGGAGGATSGNGGAAVSQGGAASAGNSNGGPVILLGGAGNGTGQQGSVLISQSAFGIITTPTAKTVSSTLLAAEIKSRIITVNQGAGAASAQQLPLASAMDTAFPDFGGGHTLEFVVLNTSVVAAESASLTTNTGWTLVGPMDIPAYSAAGSLNSVARFWARKTGAATWTLYRA